MTVIFMGVCGSGKTTVGRLFAASRGGAFLEGDSFHSPENVEKMRAGQALDDADRALWLTRLRQAIVAARIRSPLVCVACSALKAGYRAILRGDDPPGETVFVFLKGDFPLLRARMDSRSGHYMPASLLQSQFRDLEEPVDAITLDVARSPRDLVEALAGALDAEARYRSGGGDSPGAPSESS